YRDGARCAVPGAVQGPAAAAPRDGELGPQLDETVRGAARQVPNGVDDHAEVEVVRGPHHQGAGREGEPEAGYRVRHAPEAGGVPHGSLQPHALVEVYGQLQVGTAQVGDRLEVVAPGQFGEPVDAEVRGTHDAGVEQRPACEGGPAQTARPVQYVGVVAGRERHAPLRGARDGRILDRELEIPRVRLRGRQADRGRREPLESARLDRRHARPLDAQAALRQPAAWQRQAFEGV